MGNGSRRWIVTANATSDGSVVYLCADGGFSSKLADAQTFEAKDEAESARVKAAAAERVVSDPYLTEVGIAPQGLDALSARERIREQGPTIRVRRPDPTTTGR